MKFKKLSMIAALALVAGSAVAAQTPKFYVGLGVGMSGGAFPDSPANSSLKTNTYTIGSDESAGYVRQDITWQHTKPDSLVY